MEISECVKIVGLARQEAMNGHVVKCNLPRTTGEVQYISNYCYFTQNAISICSKTQKSTLLIHHDLDSAKLNIYDHKRTNSQTSTPPQLVSVVLAFLVVHTILGHRISGASS